MPPTSIFRRAPSVGTSGMGYSRISVLLGPVRTAARTFSATDQISIRIHKMPAHSRYGRWYVKTWRVKAHGGIGPKPGDQMQDAWYQACSYVNGHGVPECEWPPSLRGIVKVSEYQRAIKAWQSGLPATGGAAPQPARIMPALKTSPE